MTRRDLVFLALGMLAGGTVTASYFMRTVAPELAETRRAKAELEQRVESLTRAAEETVPK